MSITYDELRDYIGDKLGYGVSSASWSADNTRAERVERILVNGLRRVFDPDVLDGEPEQHQWSFLEVVKRITLVAGQWHYTLPADFSVLKGDPVFAPGEDTIYPPLEVTGAEQLRYLIQSSGTGRPTMCAIQLASADEGIGTHYQLLLYPTPDEAYALSLPYRINPTIPGLAGSVPLGGQPLEQTLIEACLAEASSFDEFDDGRHEIRFKERLRAAISHDRQVSSPFNLGYNRDASDCYVRTDEQRLNPALVVTYNGEVVDG